MRIRAVVCFPCFLVALWLPACAPSPREPSRRAELTDEQRAHRDEVRDWLRQELGASYDEPVAAASPDELTRGARVYGRLCASCHGAGGRGDGATSRLINADPSDLTDPELAAIYSPRGKLHIIDAGIPGTQMQGWGALLDDVDVVAVYHFIDSLVERDRPPTPGEAP